MSHIVAAIDLGTSRTAYSYTVNCRDQTGERPEVHLGVPDRLDDADVGLERKTATSILLKRPSKWSRAWQLRTFGDKAEEEYLEAKMGGEGENLALFKNFKMELYKGGRSGVPGRKVDTVMATATDNSVQVPLVLVVSLALSYIKGQIIKRLDQANLRTIVASDIRWVLTVPAIWSEFGKTFMRTAAFRGGLITTEHDYENLSLCLEPEAACLSVELNKMEPWEVGTKLMVLDCGGGTVDITTHHVTSSSPLALEELHEPTGGPWGSTIVDFNFKDFIKCVLDCEKEVWDRLDASPEMLQFMKDWEEKKTNYHPGAPIRFRMGDVLDVIEMDVRTFEATVNNCTEIPKEGGARALKKTLTLEPERVSLMFELVCKDIIEKAKEVIEKEAGISVIYMVGGFSSSPLLQEKVAAGIDQLHRGISVIFPPRPSLAIVLGAALYGRVNGSSIISRKARLTYGTKSVIQYNEKDPDLRRRSSNVVTTEGRKYLDIFSCFVERGEDLPVGTEREDTFYPLHDKQTGVSFDISMSKRPHAEIKYLSDPGIDRAVSTTITVDVPVDMSVPFSDRGVSIRLSFGGTEIHIVCKRCSDGHEVPATMIFVENMDEETDEVVSKPLQG